MRIERRKHVTTRLVDTDAVRDASLPPLSPYSFLHFCYFQSCLLLPPADQGSNLVA